MAEPRVVKHLEEVTFNPATGEVTIEDAARPSTGAPREVVIGEMCYHVGPESQVWFAGDHMGFNVPVALADAVRRVAELEDAVQAAIAEHDYQADAWSDEEHGDNDTAAYHRERAALLRSALAGTPSDHGEHPTTNEENADV